MEAAIAVLCGVLLVAGAVWSLRRWRADAAEKISFVRARALLTPAERQFLDVARRAFVPEFEICPKIGLADIVHPSAQAPAVLQSKAWQNLRQEQVDFAVCRPDTGHVLGVIELGAGEQVARGERKLFDTALEAVGIPVLRVEVRGQYDAAILRQQALATFRPPVRAAKVRAMTRRGTVWLRIDGHGTFQNSAGVRAYIEQMFDEGHRSFAFDLQSCEVMDSTFLGTLTGLALRLREDPRGRIGFAHVNARVESLFARYGLDRVLAFQGFEAAPPAPEEMAELDLLTTKEFTRGTIVGAHEALAASSPENEERFGEVVDFLKRKKTDNA